MKIVGIARGYGAKRLEEITLDPNEWDFRRVSESELHLCIKYEYARASVWFKELVESWLNSPFPDWTARAVNPITSERQIVFLERQITVREALRKEHEAEPFLKLFRALPRAIKQADADWVLSAPDFPAPYLQCREGFPDGVREYYDPAHRDEVRKAFEIVEKKPSSWEKLFSPVDADDFVSGFRVDFHQGKRAIQEQFATWLNSAWPVGIPAAPKRGKNIGQDWAKLKQLAARRLLQSAGFKAEDWFENGERIDQYRSKNPMNDPHSLLPKYTEAGPWHTAESKAIAYAESLYPLAVAG